MERERTSPEILKCYRKRAMLLKVAVVRLEELFKRLLTLLLLTNPLSLCTISMRYTNTVGIRG